MDCKPYNIGNLYNKENDGLFKEGVFYFLFNQGFSRFSCQRGILMKVTCGDSKKSCFL